MNCFAHVVLQEGRMFAHRWLERKKNHCFLGVILASKTALCLCLRRGKPCWCCLPADINCGHPGQIPARQDAAGVQHILRIALHAWQDKAHRECVHRLPCFDYLHDHGHILEFEGLSYVPWNPRTSSPTAISILNYLTLTLDGVRPR